MAIQNLLASKILEYSEYESEIVTENSIIPSVPGSMDKLIGFICEKNCKVDPKPIELKFKTEVPILQNDEVIEYAFMCGRDMFLFTNKRTIDVDAQGT